MLSVDTLGGFIKEFEKHIKGEAKYRIEAAAMGALRVFAWLCQH